MLVSQICLSLVKKKRTSAYKLSPSSLSFPGGSYGKEFKCNTGDQVRSLDWEDPLEEELATQLQYSCLENPINRRDW